MPRFVGISVEFALDFAVAPGRDYERFSSCQQRLDDTFIGIEGLVGQQSVGCHLRQQGVGALQIMRLARSQQKAQRIAKRIDQRVYLGAQPAFTAPDRLVFVLFF